MANFKFLQNVVGFIIQDSTILSICRGFTSTTKIQINSDLMGKERSQSKILICLSNPTSLWLVYFATEIDIIQGQEQILNLYDHKVVNYLYNQPTKIKFYQVYQEYKHVYFIKKISI